MYRCAHLMIKSLELRALELTPHFCSDAMPQYLEHTIRDAQSLGLMTRFCTSLRERLTVETVEDIIPTVTFGFQF
jgi:hypothetical protein